MRILVQFPTRGRLEKFSKTLQLWQSNRLTNNVKFRIIIDRDDLSMNRPPVLNSLSQWGNLEVKLCEGHGKINAINYGLAEISKDYDIIVIASDDMIPTGYGWDQRIIDDMYKHYPDGDGVLWYNDGYTADRLNTLCILGTKYFRRFGYVYHPDYKSLWCDNEFMDVANMLGKQTYFEDIIIKHENPFNTGEKGDRLNFRDNQLFKLDERTYIRRKADNFGLIINSDTDSTGETSTIGATTEPIKQPIGKPKRKRKGSDMPAIG